MNAIAAKGGLFTISGRQWLILLMVQLANMLFGMTITLANLVLPQMHARCERFRHHCNRHRTNRNRADPILSRNRRT